MLISGPEVIELDPNIKFPKRENNSVERRKMGKKRQTVEKVQVASEKAAKTLLGM